MRHCSSEMKVIGMKRIKDYWPKVALLPLVLLILTFAPATGYADVVDPTEAFYVADYANVLEAETEKYIIQMNNQLYNETGAQIVVVTIDFLDGMEIEDYAYKLFNEWGIGSSERNNGVLLLLAIGEDNYWAVQGKGLEQTLSSSTLGDILYDNLEADFAIELYDEGVRYTFDELYDQVASIYGMAPGGDMPDDYQQPGTEDSGGGWLSEFIIAFFVILFAAMFILILISNNRRRYYRSYGPVVPPVVRPRFFHPIFWLGGRQITPGEQKPKDRNKRGGGGFGGFGGGGGTRGGGTGRSSGGFGGFGSGHSSGGFGGGGGGTRGGGAGRR